MTPLTGFIDVDATSNNTGMITGHDLFAHGREFKFSGRPLQADASGEYVLDGTSVRNSEIAFQLLLESTSSFFSGLTTTINSGFSGVGGDGDLVGTLTIATAVPEPSSWAMMIMGFCGLDFMGCRRRRGQGAPLGAA